MDKETSIK